MNGTSRKRASEGIGGLSARLFGDNFAEELQPMQPSESIFAADKIANDPSRQHSAHIHIRSRPEHQAAVQQSVPRPPALSPDQLQHSMKELMKQKELWLLFKEELAMEDFPNNPETVRLVLIQFLEEHGHKISTAKARPPPAPPVNSIFQGLNLSLDQESTHGSQQNRAKAFEQMSPEELQEEMKQLMQQPELWAQYKALLAKEEHPSDPNTIRRLLIEFLKAQKGDEGAGPSGLPSFLQSIQTSLDGLSQHRPWEGMKKTPKPKEDDMHTKLRLLRNAPELYQKYQERLLSDEMEEDTSAADLLTKFMDEHKEELKELGIIEEEARRKEAFENSLMDLEFATLAEEESTVSFHRRHYHTPDGAGAQRLITQDRRQQFMAYRDSVSTRSIRSIQNAVGAVGSFLEEIGNGISNSTRMRPTDGSSNPTANDANDSAQSSDTSHAKSNPYIQQDRRQQFLAYRDTFSSRSIRTFQNAVGALAEEIEEEKKEAPPIQGPPPDQGQTANQSSQSTPPNPPADGMLRAWHDAPQEPGLTREGSFRGGWQSIVSFVQHEMRNMSTELETGKEDPSPKIDAQAVAEPEDREDLMIQQALAIALRHRSTHIRSSSLSPIEDSGEEEEIDSNSISAISEHVANVLKDPMMDVTDHASDGIHENQKRTSTGSEKAAELKDESGMPSSSDGRKPNEGGEVVANQISGEDEQPTEGITAAEIVGREEDSSPLKNEGKDIESEAKNDDSIL